MGDRSQDLATLLEDVKTIKDILQNHDAAVPRVWRPAWVGAAAVALGGLVQYFVPFFRDLDFDGRVLWLWLPGACLVFPVILAILSRDLKTTGKRFLGQGRFRNLLFARFVVPPAALVLVWTASRNPVFPLEGICLLALAIWQSTVEQALPRAFRAVPVGFLGLGLAELAFRWSGPEVVLLNVLLTAGAIAAAGFLFRNQTLRTEGRAPGV